LSRLADFPRSHPPGDMALGDAGPMADERLWLNRVAPARPTGATVEERHRLMLTRR
jgi:hypothetical protein